MAKIQITQAEYHKLLAGEQGVPLEKVREDMLFAVTEDAAFALYAKWVALHWEWNKWLSSDDMSADMRRSLISSRRAIARQIYEVKNNATL